MGFEIIDLNLKNYLCPICSSTEYSLDLENRRLDCKDCEWYLDLTQENFYEIISNNFSLKHPSIEVRLVEQKRYNDLLSKINSYKLFRDEPDTKFKGLIVGNNLDKVFEINHGLNTEDLVIQVLDLNSKKFASPDVEILSPNNIVISFGQPPAGETEEGLGDNQKYKILAISI